LLDDTDLSGGDTYAQQGRYGAGGYNRDDTGQQRSDNWTQGTAGPGAGTTSDRYDTAGQYSSSDRFASDQTSGGADPSMGSAGQLDRDDGPAGGGGGKPSATSKVMGTSLRVIVGAALESADVKGCGASGTAERMVGKMSNDPGKQARGQERQVIGS